MLEVSCHTVTPLASLEVTAAAILSLWEEMCSTGDTDWVSFFGPTRPKFLGLYAECWPPHFPLTDSRGKVMVKTRNATHKLFLQVAMDSSPSEGAGFEPGSEAVLDPRSHPSSPPPPRDCHTSHKHLAVRI